MTKTSPSEHRLAIVRTASPRCEVNLAEAAKHLTECGFSVELFDGDASPQWPYTAGSAAQRAQRLIQTLVNPDIHAILCARGGYGCSDLLPLLPWNELAQLPEKLIVGFSDISALHAAFWQKLSWPGLHAPMPATDLWQSQGKDVASLIRLLKRESVEQELNVVPWGNADTLASLDGWLFGGCWSVLTNLIGTPYFPKKLHGAILFLEDTDETAPRLLRYWNQWVQSESLAGVKALLLGTFRNCGMSQDAFLAQLVPQLTARFSLPVFTTAQFGHTSPNLPLMIGATARIQAQRLTWQSPKI